MSQLPSIELLETQHVFPGPFVFKAIGKGSQAFVDGLVAVVRAELGYDFDPPCDLNFSRGGRHVAVTFTPQVESSQQVLAIFRGFQQVDGLMMLL